jgi:hypothetical protein
VGILVRFVATLYTLDVVRWDVMSHSMISLAMLYLVNRLFGINFFYHSTIGLKPIIQLDEFLREVYVPIINNTIGSAL